MLEETSVQPALYNAFLLTTKDALVVFEAAKRGITPFVTRRLQDREKASLIASGAVFIFDEKATGIKRWTDGAIWSPSRIVGNYLVYRELDKKGTLEADRPAEIQGAGFPGSSGGMYQDVARHDMGQNKMLDTISQSSLGSTGLRKDVERALIGSLHTGYRFKAGGLVKKTISNGSLHIISYYTIEDVKAGRLRTPSSLNELVSLEISPSLLEPKHFRTPPVSEQDTGDLIRYIKSDEHLFPHPDRYGSAGWPAQTDSGPSEPLPLHNDGIWRQPSGLTYAAHPRSRSSSAISTAPSPFPYEQELPPQPQYMQYPSDNSLIPLRRIPRLEADTSYTDPHWIGARPVEIPHSTQQQYTVADINHMPSSAPPQLRVHHAASFPTLAQYVQSPASSSGLRAQPQGLQRRASDYSYSHEHDRRMQEAQPSYALPSLTSHPSYRPPPIDMPQYQHDFIPYVHHKQ